PRRDLIGLERWRLTATRSLTIAPPSTTSWRLVRGDVHESRLRVVTHGEPRMPHARVSRVQQICQALFRQAATLRRLRSACRGGGDSDQINLLQRAYDRSIDSSRRKDFLPGSNVERIEHAVSRDGHDHPLLFSLGDDIGHENVKLFRAAWRRGGLVMPH